MLWQKNKVCSHDLRLEAMTAQRLGQLNYQYTEYA